MKNNIDKDIDMMLEALILRKQNRQSPTSRINPTAVNNAANAVKSMLNSVMKGTTDCRIKDGGFSKTVICKSEEEESPNNKTAFSRIAKMVETRTRNLPISITVRGEFAGNKLNGIKVRIAPSMKYKFKIK